MIKLNPSRILLNTLISCQSLPVDLKEGKVISHSLTEALKLKLPFALVKKDYLDKNNSRPFYMSPLQMIKIKKRHTEFKKSNHSISLPKTILALLASLIETKTNDETLNIQPLTTSHNFEGWLNNVGLSKRKEQLLLIEKGISALEKTNDAIVFAEASVGVGKTHALATIAINEALKNKESLGSIVIAAPNYQIAKQIINAAQGLLLANDISVTTSLYRSRAEYISEQSIRFYIEHNAIEANTLDQVNALLSEKQFLKSLYEVAGINCKDLSLTRHSGITDEAEEQYLEDRKQAQISKIIVCTHALIACHISMIARYTYKKIDLDLTKKYYSNEINELIIEYITQEKLNLMDIGLLPTIDLLLIDEAHQIFDNYAALKNTRIAFSNIKKAITESTKEGVINKNKSKELKQIIDDFSQKLLRHLSTNNQFPSRFTYEFQQNFNRVLKTVKKRTPLSPSTQFLFDTLDDLYSLCLNPASSHEQYLSPIKNMLSIQNSPIAPLDWLDLTWKLSEKAFLTSGTLAIAASSDDVYSQLAVKLCVNISRKVNVKPIETEWLRTGVTLFTTPPIKHKNDLIKYKGSAFLPPEHSKPELIYSWSQKQAQYIQDALRRSKGGSLILCTSYDQLSILFNCLKKLIAKDKHYYLFESKAGLSITAQINIYKAAYEKDLRPVWIAIGTAGTGVDISDMSELPENDFMLNDLFITRLPISPNNKQGFMEKIRDAVIALRQYFGRLIRRPGRKSTSIHVMDARANQSKGVNRLFQSQLRKYTIVEINIDE